MSSLIPEMISDSVPIKSTKPVDSDWNLALEKSFLSCEFPFIAFGEFTKTFALSCSINTKSLSPLLIAIPPPLRPNTACICGITPLAFVCAKYIFPKASNASKDSSSLRPAQSTSPTTGAPIFIAISYSETIFFACISPIEPPSTEGS